MKSNEARIAEAVAALTARLDGWGVADPAEKAHDYVTDMLRNGWRPRALPVELPSPSSPVDRRPPTSEYRDARRALGCHDLEESA